MRQLRRTTALITVAAVMLTTMALGGGSAFAVDPPTQGNPSCFGAYARTVEGPPGPGEGVSELASSGAALVADELVPLIQGARDEACPPPEPPSLP
jgi:N-methylhydantoinase A/oxoprolinase/acetone carboxylase beta subunit